MHAYALELLNIHENDKILDIGCGSGYLSACFAKLTHNQVIAIDHLPELVKLSQNNVSKGNPEITNLQYFTVDGRFGYKPYAPYDVIHVGAAASELHSDLLQQLSNHGRLLIPVGKQDQKLMLVTRNGNEYHKQSLMDVMYVPLTDKENQF
eukprot:NODE_567_length_5957_cov_0.651588.p4 type:complete len:151 gc:universal NODE_567_length_5957_cov_0.651588:3504-3052(-)